MGQVQEVQFTGSRGLMRFSQLILGFERNKQGDGDNKSLSQIRVLKDRRYGQAGIVPTIYNPVTGRLRQRTDDEYDKNRPFELPGTGDETTIPNGDQQDRPF